MKTTRIQLGMEWVRGPLKFQLMMTTVTRMLTVFMMKVKSKYCEYSRHNQIPNCIQSDSSYQKTII